MALRRFKTICGLIKHRRINIPMPWFTQRYASIKSLKVANKIVLSFKELSPHKILCQYRCVGNELVWMSLSILVPSSNELLYTFICEGSMSTDPYEAGQNVATHSEIGCSYYTNQTFVPFKVTDRSRSFQLRLRLWQDHQKSRHATNGWDFSKRGSKSRHQGRT